MRKYGKIIARVQARAAYTRHHQQIMEMWDQHEKNKLEWEAIYNAQQEKLRGLQTFREKFEFVQHCQQIWRDMRDSRLIKY